MRRVFVVVEDSLLGRHCEEPLCRARLRLRGPRRPKGRAARGLDFCPKTPEMLSVFSPSIVEGNDDFEGAVVSEYFDHRGGCSVGR